MIENLATIWSLHYPNPNSTHSTLFLKVIESPLGQPSPQWLLCRHHIKIREDSRNEVDSLLSASGRLSPGGMLVFFCGVGGGGMMLTREGNNSVGKVYT